MGRKTNKLFRTISPTSPEIYSSCIHTSVPPLPFISAMSSLRDQIIGAWELIEFCEYLPSDESNKVHPMGSDASGIIMYTPDGYMSAQLQASNDQPDPAKKVMTTYVGYTGQFYLDEQGDAEGPVLLHHMRHSNLQILVGDTQRRFVKIVDQSDGKWLVLGAPGQTKVGDEQRIVRVRWRRLPENHATSPPKL